MAGASILAVLRLVAVETRQHPLPLPGLGSKGASLPYMANGIVVATLFMSWSRVGCINASFAAVYRLPMDPFVFASNIPFELFQ